MCVFHRQSYKEIFYVGNMTCVARRPADEDKVLAQEKFSAKY